MTRYTQFPPTFNTPTGVKNVIDKASLEGNIGVDFEFNPDGVPTVIGVASKTRCAAYWWTEELGKYLMEASGQYVAFAGIGADKPIIEGALKITTPLKRWDDPMIRHYLVNPDLASVPKSTVGEDEDDPAIALGLMNLWCCTSLLHDVPNWKRHSGPDCKVCPKCDVLSYCAYDAWAGLVDEYSLREQMVELGIPEAYYEFRRELAEYCEWMHDKGVLTDPKVIKELDETITTKKMSLFPYEWVTTTKTFKNGKTRDLKPKKVQTGPFNPNSLKAVYAWFKANGIELFDKGKPSVSKPTVQKVLTRLLKPYGLEFNATLGEIEGELDVDLTLPEPVDILIKLAQKQCTGKGIKSWFDPQYVKSDQTVHPRFNACGTSMGRLSSSKPNFQNCFDSKTEVLTKTGWKFLAEVTVGEEVAQWDLGKITFVIPILTSRSYTGALHQLKNQHIDLSLTSDHRCLLVSRKSGELKEFKAQDYPEEYHQIHSGIYVGSGLPLTADELKFIVAVQADGSLRQDSPSGIDFSFIKERKASRLEDLLYRTGWEFENYSGPTRYRYLITDVRAQQIIVTYLGPNKLFGSWLLEASPEQLEIFLTETKFWDGLFGTKVRMYASCVKVNTDWVQIVAVLLNKRTHGRVITNNSGSVSYQLDITHQNYSGTTNIEHTIKEVTDETVYCLSVPSSYVLVRRNGQTAITGQCPRVGFGKEVRKAIIARPGYKLLKADYSQLEFRICLWFVGLDPSLSDGAFEYLVRESNGSFEEPAKRLSWTPRDVGKSLVHGGNYQEGISVRSTSELENPKAIGDRKAGALIVYDGIDYPLWTFKGKYVCFTGVNLSERLFGDKTRVNRAKALKLQKIYLDAYPIRQFQMDLAKKVEAAGEMRLPSGHRLPLYGRQEEDDLKMAAALLGQGGGSIYAQEAMLRFKKLNQIMLMQVHDEFVFEVPENFTDLQCADYLEPMVQESVFMPGFTCPIKYKVGPNWKEMREIGTLGLFK